MSYGSNNYLWSTIDVGNSDDVFKSSGCKTESIDSSANNAELFPGCRIEVEKPHNKDYLPPIGKRK